jgi:hypothetical protein
MDLQMQTQAIEDQLDTLQNMPVNDDPTARAAFAHTMTTVSRINQLSAQAHAQAMLGTGGPADMVLASLKDWLNRLVNALTQIVAHFAKATSFSVSMGTTLSVSVSFQA